MPYANGHIYRTSTLGVSRTDIKTALGVDSNKLDVLCTHANINRWAKFKPEARPQVVSLTLVHRKADKYGFTIPSQISTVPSNLITYYGQSDNGWVYTARTGCYRMLDFCNSEVLAQGYYPAAKAPIALYTPAVSWRFTTGSKIQFSAIGAINSAEEIGLDDIAEVLGSNTLYFGVALFKGTNLTPTQALSAPCVVATAGLPITKSSQGYAGLVAEINYFNIQESQVIGNWTVVPFLSLTRIDQWSSWGGSPVSTTFYPCPVVGMSTLSIESATSQYTVNFTGTKEALRLVGELKITNNSSSAITLNVTDWVWDSSVSGTPDTRQKLSYEVERAKGTVTIPANSTVTVDSYSLVKGGSTGITQQLYDYAVAYVRIGTDLKGPFSFLRINL